jgi:hypothetical protein
MFKCFKHAKTSWFVLSLEHVNFAINEKNPKQIMTIQIIMLHLWSFKHIKMQF